MRKLVFTVLRQLSDVGVFAILYSSFNAYFSSSLVSTILTNVILSFYVIVKILKLFGFRKRKKQKESIIFKLTSPTAVIENVETDGYEKKAEMAVNIIKQTNKGGNKMLKILKEVFNLKKNKATGTAVIVDTAKLAGIVTACITFFDDLKPILADFNINNPYIVIIIAVVLYAISMYGNLSAGLGSFEEVIDKLQTSNTKALNKDTLKKISDIEEIVNSTDKLRKYVISQNKEATMLGKRTSTPEAYKLELVTEKETLKNDLVK